jgi:hypothetical protein
MVEAADELSANATINSIEFLGDEKNRLCSFQ